MLRRTKRVLPIIAAGLVLVFALFTGCSDDSNPSAPGGDGELTFDFNFQSSSAGFGGGFADYPEDYTEDMEMTFERRRLPASLDSTKYGLFFSCRNTPDDVFMFVKKKLGAAEGIQPGVVYLVTMEIRIATPEASDCVGAGGAPGEAQYMKAGATVVEPLPVLNDEGFFEMNIRKGQQSGGGEDMEVIGHVGNSSGDCTGETWEFKTLTLTDFAVQTDDSATLWLVAGTDSGYEGINYYYFTDFSVKIEPTSLDSLP